jgi:hypothetical protein
MASRRAVCPVAIFRVLVPAGTSPKVVHDEPPAARSQAVREAILAGDVLSHRVG